MSKSSAEAEYRSMAMIVPKLVWIVGMFKELGVELELPIELHCNNKEALHISADAVYHERAKHIEIDCYFIRE